MNDDDPREMLVMLKAEHRRLDEEIERMRLAGNCDQLELARMKKRKLHLRTRSSSSPTASRPTSSPDCVVSGSGQAARWRRRRARLGRF